MLEAKLAARYSSARLTLHAKPAFNAPKKTKEQTDRAPVPKPKIEQIAALKANRDHPARNPKTPFSGPRDRLSFVQ